MIPLCVPNIAGNEWKYIAAYAIAGGEVVWKCDLSEYSYTCILNVPCGASIVLTCIGLFVLSLLVNRLRRDRITAVPVSSPP